jgi:hypothetical protein
VQVQLGLHSLSHLLKDSEEKFESVQQIEITYFYEITDSVTGYNDCAGSEYEYYSNYVQYEGSLYEEYCKHEIYLETPKIGLEQISYKQRKMEEAIVKVPHHTKYKHNKSLSRPETFPGSKKEQARHYRRGNPSIR